MMGRKGGGAPRGNKNAAGDHKPSSAIRSGLVGMFGPVGTGAHAAANTLLGKQVRSGSHALGGALGGALVGGINGGLTRGVGGAIGGTLAGAAAYGGLSYLGSKSGQVLAKVSQRKRKK